MSPRVLVDLRVGQTTERTGLARAAWSLADALVARQRGTYLLAGAYAAGDGTAVARAPHTPSDSSDAASASHGAMAPGAATASDAVVLPFDIPVGDHGRGEKWMAALAELYDADAILSTYHALPAAPRPRVLTIHDLLPLRHPEWFADARVLRFFDVTLRESAHCADRIIVDTEVVRGDVVELFGIASDRIAVVPLAPVLPQTRTADMTDAADVTDRARVRALGIDGPFLLTVATLEPRKNLVRLVQAYAAAKARASADWPRLVIAGRLGWKWREILDASASTHGVHVAGYVDDETLAALLHTAIAFVFPSLDEGFGLPVLEAMACGCPVLTSDVPVLREVAGDAAAFIDPRDVEGLAAGMEALVADGARRRALVQRGYQRAAQFSWARTAAGVEAVIASVV